MEPGAGVVEQHVQVPGAVHDSVEETLHVGGHPQRLAREALSTADLLSPRTTRSAIAGRVSAEPAADIALHHLGLQALLNLDIRLGEGTGACLAASLLGVAAADFLASQSATC